MPLTASIALTAARLIARAVRSRMLPILVAICAAPITTPAGAQEAPDVVGSWHGELPIPTGGVTLVLHVARSEDGTTEASIENFDLNPGTRVPITDIDAADGRLTFQVRPINASYEGRWDEASKQWKGTLSQGAALPLDLARGKPPARPVIDGLDGFWEGTVERNGVSLRQILSVRTLEQGTFAVYASPDQLINGIPLTDLARHGPTVRFAAYRGVMAFNGTLSEDGKQLSGTWVSSGQPDLDTVFTRAATVTERPALNRPQHPVAPFPYKAEDVAFDNFAAPGVRLTGTLTLPPGDGPFPAAILLTGSGPHDRDGEMMGHKPFAVIADYLTRSGIAVLRYDDRGVGESTGNYAEAISTDHASDANAAFAYLTTRPEIRRDAIGFIGHSEGGITASTAMADNDDVAYFVSLATPGTDFSHLMLSQRRLVAARSGMKEAEIARSDPVVAALYQAISETETPEAGYAAAMKILTPEAKAELGVPPEFDSAMLIQRMQLMEPWLQYLLKYETAPNLSRITVPVLALSGSLDVQAPAAENLAAIRTALKGNPDVTITELPGLNHMFQKAITGAIGEYADIEETFSPAALALISDWITKRFIGR